MSSHFAILNILSQAGVGVKAIAHFLACIFTRDIVCMGIPVHSKLFPLFGPGTVWSCKQGLLIYGGSKYICTLFRVLACRLYPPWIQSGARRVQAGKYSHSSLLCVCR